MYGDDGDFRSPLILAPQGTATPEADGYRLNGRWNYNSGGEHANWVAVSAFVPGATEGAPPEDLLLAFIRREDYEIFDNWHVMGMRGTGSKQAVVEDVFVPASRVISQPAWGAGEAPGFGVHDNPFYRTARARVDAAAAVLDRIVNNQAEYAEQARAGTLAYSKEETTRTMMRVQQLSRLVTEAIDVLFESSGTSATQSGQPIERIYRDLSTARTHYIMDADRSAENWGATFFGLEEHTPY
jgi:3-hydroxy-9,10-secoandrosta-1,3,5(10)-triene-9,17-dione monooxygenase